MFNIYELFNKNSNYTFITAEIGINHLGDLDLAKTHIKTAKECGADAVKFQIFKTEKFYNSYLLPDGFNIFKSLELSFENFLKLKEFADSLDILFYATPLDLDSLNFLVNELKSTIIKIASSDITNEPFLLFISDIAYKKNLVVILSTGFVEEAKIDRAFNILKKNKLIIEYCVSKYPCYPEDFDLKFIELLKKKYKIPIGFSDHSLDNIMSYAAVSLGAKAIERHFTIDDKLNGGDHSISLNPNKFSELVQNIRKIEKALGSGKKKISEFEKQITYHSMRSIYAARDIKKGEVITENDILFLRPGNGIDLKKYYNIINKKALRNYNKYEEI